MKQLFAVIFVLFSLTACKLDAVFDNNEVNDYHIANEKTAVVAIIATNNAVTPPANGLGTGFFIRENYIITNYHVAGDPSFSLKVGNESSDKTYEAEVIYGDKDTDIAVIKLKNWDEFKKDNPQVTYLKFAEVLPKVTDPVWAIGHPWGLFYSISRGVVSNDGRKSPAKFPMWWIQTDAHVYEGNSGGPLLNDDGDVIGINSVMIAQTGGSYGFAIPESVIQKVIRDLEKYKQVRWASLGIVFEGPGVKVKELAPDGAAKKFGLLVGDSIVSVNTDEDGREIHVPFDLIEFLSGQDYQSKIELGVMRDGTLITVEVEPGFKLSTDYK